MSGFHFDTVDDSKSSGRKLFLPVVLVSGAIAIGFALFLRNSITHHAPRSPLAGSLAPRIEAEGWFNGEAPAEESLKGKVVVVDAWAWWCGPCRMALPDLIRLEKKYSKEGVVFLGLTVEDRRSLSKSKQFIADAGVPWPNGYGASATLDQLQIEGIPAVTIIDRAGVIVDIVVGAGNSHHDIERAIRDAISRKP